MLRHCLSLIVLASLTAAAPAAPLEVETLDGRTVAGKLVEWTGEALKLETADGPQTVTRAELLAVRPAESASSASAAPTVWLELSDGTRLEGSQFTVAKGVGTLTLAEGKLEIPARSILAVRFKAQDEAIAKQWEQIRALKPSADLIVIRKKDAIDYLEGVLGDISTEKVTFELEGEAVPVSRSKVEGVLYYAAARRELSPGVCVVQGLGGTQIQAKEVKLTDEGVAATSVGGLKLTLPWNRVQGLDFSLGKIQYLGDMKATTSDWTPFYAVYAELPAGRKLFEPRMNRAISGGPLTLAKQTYRRGLALRSGTELTYRVPDGFQRFTAIAGIDDQVADGGQVVLTVRGDDRELFSQTLRGGEAPQTIDVDIAGVRRLTIQVGYGDDSDVSDHLDLCDARISK